ncbi:hypothetical protein Tco_1367776 [Tanacetum coccineum]
MSGRLNARKSLREIPRGKFLDDGARDDVQSGLVSPFASVTTNNQRLISEWNTNDLLVTNNDSMVPCQPIHADYKVETTEFYGHYVDVENGVLNSYPSRPLATCLHFWHLDARWNHHSDSVSPAVFCLLFGVVGSECFLEVSSTSSCSQRAFSKIADLLALSSVANSMHIALASTLITGASSLIPSSSRCPTILGYVANLLVISALYSEWSIMVKFALDRQGRDPAYAFLLMS